MRVLENPKLRLAEPIKHLVVVLHAPIILLLGASGMMQGGNELPVTPTFRQYCFACHGGSKPMAGLSLDKLTAQFSIGENFQQWEKVAAALEKKTMPPQKMPQPNDEQRHQAVRWIRTKLDEFAAKYAGDPGRVTVRRLTSAEYAYTIQDLTGLALKFDRDFATDTVGGEGFTNFGDVQFIEEANLERYLDAAKTVASHAVIGSGPIHFFADPGDTGLELSAISRIKDIYQKYGFRAVSGEGGKPYGLERYAKAFYVAWRYRHRAALGEATVTLKELAVREGITPRFAEHIWSVLNLPSPTYPTSDVVAKWQNLPAPASGNREQVVKEVRARCDDIQKFVTDWPRWLFAAGDAAEGGRGDERSFDLTEESLQVRSKQRLRFVLRARPDKPKRVHLSVLSVNPNSQDRPVVIWSNGVVRFRGTDRSLKEPQPLTSVLDEATKARLAFGKHPNGSALDPQAFALASDAKIFFDVVAPPNTGGLELEIDAEVDLRGAGDAIVRCTLSDREYRVLMGGTPVSALLGDPQHPGFKKWKSGVLEFAARLPQNSQGEPTPSDKDPIPPPFNNTYNQPERDHYHLKLKYYRQDQYLVENVLEEATRKELDHAWNDLLSSFEYHDEFLRFVVQKFNLGLKVKTISELSEAQIAALPEEPRKYVKALYAEHKAIMEARRAAQPGHVEDCIQFAEKAWRRPLTESEKEKLRAFYRTARDKYQLDHPKAIRSLLTRILVSPAFLFRVEQAGQLAKDRPLIDWELASRLSYFLWSSLPDDELRRAAAAGELRDPEQLRRQVKRMLADPKARRLATEFFGQWLGFYRFDQHRGVDTKRFPEFTDEVKAAMYDEAVSFFEYIIRNDRPVREMIFADYTFLNQALAKHYGVPKEIAATDKLEMVQGASAFHRGGLLRLGAVLTATSAPLRTSPVKRGDWVLRRVLGTPTPPPPADAGSIPADDKLFGGLTVRERLEAHKRNAACASCHTRIDPLGFPLERYDAVGRWREQYPDGKPIHDAGELADKTEIAGVSGLLKYLESQEQQVLRNFSNKLLGYALGRTILASDRPLIDKLTRIGGEASFSDLAAEIVTSRQFRYRRDRDEVPPNTPKSIASRTPRNSQSED